METPENGETPPPSESPMLGGDDGQPELPVARQCQECGADMLDGQDWCLTCGTAAPGRLGARPGWRAVTTISALTLLLVLGAVAASYAALSQNANDEAAAPPSQVASVPSDTNTIAQIPAGPTGVPSIPSIPGTTSSSLPTLPTTSTPSTSLPSLPSIPTISTPTISIPTTATTTSTPAETTTTTATTPTTTTTTTTPTTPELTPISLPADAVALYDPYKHATKSTDPADSYDGKESTQTSITTDPAKKTMDVGLVIDLGSAKQVAAVEIHTSTPDFALELYGADGSAVPTDILDARWQHLRSRLHVDGPGTAKPNDGIERIKLKKATNLRHILLWFARPPKQGSTVTIPEIEVLH